ncbi:Ketosteroid isomerase homolog [Flavobacterium fluvii]|uniref:Ketosteroid isomerase homolog n=1 Tax=Flavobacterium fluvii TaxID=468056 RepID=A0A1M5ISD5_9FLAO|nr:nuclear transport factor 2 family protein [Flavobacterium fluvii]SHG31244.1 Ketosteroid isomerase homolog [Flavobacterium fluvii]
MKNKFLIGGLLLFILTLSIACNQKKEEPTAATPAIDNEQIKTEIQAVEDAFAAVYNSGNIDALTYYADDATSFFNGKLPLVGKDAIHQSIKEELANFTKGDKISFETKEVYVSENGNHVVEIGAYKFVDSTGAKLRSGNYFSLFKKIDGKYKCIRDMGNSEPADPTVK